MIEKNFSIIDIIFPQVCGICEKLNKDGLCKKCESKLERLSKTEIIDMNKKSTIQSNEIKRNYDYCFDTYYFNQLLSIFNYEGLIRKLILDYKFNGKSYIYVSFVKFILKKEKIFEKLKSYDTIIPVPISKRRMKERGYNQSLLIAKKISKDLNIKLQTNCLFKNKNIIEQSKLNKEQRIQNIQNVYELKNKQILNNKRILLVDDIYTTGSTVNECSKVLRQANPKNIDVLVLAKD